MPNPDKPYVPPVIKAEYRGLRAAANRAGHSQGYILHAAEKLGLKLQTRRISPNRWVYVLTEEAWQAWISAQASVVREHLAALAACKRQRRYARQPAPPPRCDCWDVHANLNLDSHTCSCPCNHT